MIKVTAKRNADGIYSRVCLEGHAGYAEYGFDIVCSAVSVLVINTVNSIEQFTEDDLVVEHDGKTDRFEFYITSEISHETELLMNSLILGLQGIKEEYGNEHITLFI